MITMSEGKKENISVRKSIIYIPVNTTFTGIIMTNTLVVYYGNGRQEFKKPYNGLFIKKETHLIYFPFPFIDSRNINAELIKLDYNNVDMVENYHPVNLSITYIKE